MKCKVWAALALLIGLQIGLLLNAHDHTPAKPEPYNSIWLQNETGLNIAPRVTLEPKP